VPIRAVLWDIDDTIFDYTGAERDGALAHFEAEGLLSAYGGSEQALGLWREVMEFHYDRFLAGELTFAEQRRERARDFLGRRSMDDAEADAWFAGYRAHFEASAATAFPDVLPALNTLTPAYRHGVLSNSSVAQQEPKLRRLGLRDRFECLLCSDELGHAKPAPEAFLAACDALGLPPREVAYVGDKPDTDARGADAAGLFGVWLDRAGRTPAPPDLRRITDLGQLPGLLTADTRFGAPSPIG
jgi:putative hydrolase of the HAD superfamily